MPDPRDEERLFERLMVWEERRRHGQTVTAESLCAGCPDLADELARRIAALLAMEALLGGPDEPHADPEPPLKGS